MKPFKIVLLGILLISFMGCTKENKEKKESSIPEKPKINPGDMVLIPAGEFIMGTNELLANIDEVNRYRSYPEHKVNLPAFYIDKFEVTNGEYLKFTMETGYTSEAEEENKSWRLFFGNDPAKENYPAVNLTWDDANAYAKWAGKRLPTEAEWEKAARGTDGRRYPWGNEWTSGKSNTFEAGGRYREIGAFEGDLSPFGVYDTLGNVQEWTSSWYKAYPGNKKRNPDFGEKYRIVRGGSYAMKGNLYHIWDRTAYPEKSLFGVGFRCVKNAEKAGMRNTKKGRLAQVHHDSWRIALGLFAATFSRFPS